MMKQPVTPSYGFALEKELLDMEDDFSPRSASPIPYSEPHLRRLEQLERMLETMDRMDPTVSQPPPPHHHHQGYFPPAHPAPPPHHLLHQMDHPHAPMEREGRGWMYPERGRPAPPPQQARQQQPMLPPGGPRTAAKNCAVEMEQRRIQELHQMQMAKEKEVEAYGGRGGFGKGPSSSSKPNISLLPTAVMRHIHTSKPSQTVSQTRKKLEVKG